MGNPPFEDVSPIQMVVFHCYVSLPEGRDVLSTLPETNSSPLKIGRAPKGN